MTVRGCLELVRSLRQYGVPQPLLLMSYINPLLAYRHGELYAQSRQRRGGWADRAGPAAGGRRRAGRGLPPPWLAMVFCWRRPPPRSASPWRPSAPAGFIYLVSVTGVTGAGRRCRPTWPISSEARAPGLRTCRWRLDLGLPRQQQAAQVGRLADGVIVGSALINAVDQASDPCSAAGECLIQSWPQPSSQRQACPVDWRT